MGSQLKGVLFDLDDTLIDWSGVSLGWRELEAARLSRVLSFLNPKQSRGHIELDQLVELYSELTRAAWTNARMSLRAPNMPKILLATLTAMGIAQAEQFVEEILAAYDWKVVPGTAVFPDVVPILEMLRPLGIKLGIVTNASQPMAMRDAELVGHGLIDYFPDCRLAAADTGYLKPHARIFQCALNRMGTAPAETVFIGDNPEADIAGALAVGMRAVRRITGRADDNGDLTPPHRSLHTLDELPAILDEWYPGWRNGGA